MCYIYICVIMKKIQLTKFFLSLNIKKNKQAISLSHQKVFPEKIPHSSPKNTHHKSHFLNKEFQKESTLKWKTSISKCKNNLEMLKEEIITMNLLKKGIPYDLKAQVWGILLSINEYPSLGVFEDKLSSIDKYQISVDVKRTIKYNSKINEEHDLVELLEFYAHYNPSIGYCQGMSDIAVNILEFFDLTQAKIVFIKLIEGNKATKFSIFDRTLSMMTEILSQQRLLIKKIEPRLYKFIYPTSTTNIDMQDVDLVFMKWFITYFTRYRQIKDRVWDYFIFYGFDVLFYFTIAILKYFEHDIYFHANSSEDLVIFLNGLDCKFIEPNTLITIVEEYIRTN